MTKINMLAAASWNCFAGGTFAASDKHSWQLYLKGFGTFHIDPVSSPYNVERHMGYSVRFTSTEGRKDIKATGLWSVLLRLVDGKISAEYPLTNRGLVRLVEARKICRDFYLQHNQPEWYDWAKNKDTHCEVVA